MTHFAGIDVSLETSSICIADGAVVRELKVDVNRTRYHWRQVKLLSVTV